MSVELQKYIEFTKRWEGGLSNDTDDSASVYPCPTHYKGKSGYHTNIGITYKTWVSIFGTKNDLRFLEMNADDWFNVFKTLYWNGVRADEYKSIKIGIIVTQMAWGSGKKVAVKTLQTALNKIGSKVVMDGILGNKTIEAANAANPDTLFSIILAERESFFRKIGVGKNANYLKGWLNRLDDLRKTFEK